MSFHEKIKRCNARDLARYLPFVVDGTQLGWITPQRAEFLRAFPHVFVHAAETVTLAPKLADVPARTAALENIAPDLAATGNFRKGTGEMYAVRNAWSDPPALFMDRMLVPAFGARAYGVHLNGYVVKTDGLYLWIGTRADDRIVELGKLDNMVAGGQPGGLSISENILKEAEEEAGLSPDLARTAKSASVITYCFETANGLRNDTLFCYDLEMPEGVMPRNTDGEISGFELVALPDVLDLVRDTDRFKFNVNLVIIDFAMRWGALTPENTPFYEEMAAGLREMP